MDPEHPATKHVFQQKCKAGDSIIFNEKLTLVLSRGLLPRSVTPCCIATFPAPSPSFRIAPVLRRTGT
jgi:hypothetical protein